MYRSKGAGKLAASADAGRKATTTLSEKEGAPAARLLALNLAVLSAFLVSLTLFLPTASAKVIHPFTGTSFGPKGVAGSETFAAPTAIAVDQTSGDIYVYDSGPGRLFKFDSAGEPADFSATSSNSLFASAGGGREGGGTEIGVAPSGAFGGTEGDLYVVDGGEGIKIFAPSGVELGVINEGLAANRNYCGVATDPAGRVFSGDVLGGNSDITEYVPTADPPTQADRTGRFANSSGSLCNVAADGSGHVYGARGTKGVIRLEGLSDPAPTVVDPDAATIAVDPSDDDLYADRGAEVVQYDSAGNRLGDSGGGVLSPSSYGVAVNGSSGKLYAADSGSGRVDIFGPPESVPLPPTVTSPSATEVTETTATIGAIVTPGGVLATYHIEYVPDAQYRTEGGFSGPATIRTAETPIGSDEQPRQASASVIGLLPGTTYDFRLVATNTSPGDPVVPSAVRTFLTRSHASGEAAGGCPNETLRAEDGSLALPDCRAYERVTPSTKNGTEFNSQVRTFVGDGPRLAAETFGNFGGTEFSFLFGAAYEFTRSPSGWMTTPLTPSASRFQGTNAEQPLYALGDGGRTLFGLRERGMPNDAESFYLRHGATTEEVGPEAPFSTYRGPVVEQTGDTVGNYFAGYRFVTPDLSHVVYLLSSPGEHDYLWPFDDTEEGGRTSAYEYVGTGQSQPFLVGVTGGPGSSQLISGCGTWIGSHYGEDIYNAVSRDGRTVFFTPIGEDEGACPSTAGQPPTTGVYARVDGEGPDAHTVDISEPSSADCSECQTGAPGYAAFQGASEDGSKVLFMTEQELLPGNPGKNLYQYDFNAPAGAKVTAVSHQTSGAASGVLGVTRVSEDGSHVYFVATAELTGEPNSTGASAQPGAPNLYVYDTGSETTAFVATLSPLNNEGISPDASLWGESDERRPAEATPDGRYLLFASSAQPTPDDTGTASQLFRYDAATGRLNRVSVGQDGYNDDGNTDADPVTIPFGFDRFSGYQSGPPQRMMSDDGSEIFFESTAALASGALDHARLSGRGGLLAENVYEWHNGRVSLLSDGRDRTHIGVQNVFEQRSTVRLLGTDSNGEDVFFTTSSQLAPADRDSAQDIYDARVDGGFVESDLPPCTGEGCQGPLAAAPAVTGASSAALAGPSNRRPRRHHKHHHKRRHRHRKQHHRSPHNPPRHSAQKGLLR